MRAVVLLPTATLPAMPMTYGTFGGEAAEERVGHAVEVLAGRDVQVQQPRQRQVDVGDLVERQIAR